MAKPFPFYLGKAFISAKPPSQQSLYLGKASISAKPPSRRSLFFTFLPFYFFTFKTPDTTI